MNIPSQLGFFNGRLIEQGECWVWDKWKPGKYCNVRYRGATWTVHRLSYFLTHGPIPNGLFVCHHCDNPPCINPAHLFLGTCRDNSQDCLRKGRLAVWVKPERVARGDRNGMRTHPEKIPRGERHGAARLTTEQVQWIRANVGLVAPPDMAAKFSVHCQTIYHVIKRETWRHL